MQYRFNTPFTVPWLTEKMEIATWCKPFTAGLFGTLQDFSLNLPPEDLPF